MLNKSPGDDCHRHKDKELDGFTLSLIWAVILFSIIGFVVVVKACLRWIFWFSSPLLRRRRQTPDHRPDAEKGSCPGQTENKSSFEQKERLPDKGGSKRLHSQIGSHPDKHETDVIQRSKNPNDDRPTINGIPQDGYVQLWHPENDRGTLVWPARLRRPGRMETT